MAPDECSCRSSHNDALTQSHYFRHSLNLDKSGLADETDCACSGFADGGGHAEVGGSAGAAVDLGEFFVGAAEPALAFGFGDAGGEVVADLGDAGPLGGVWPVQGAAQECSWMQGVPKA